MDKLYKELKASNVLIIGTPVYTDTMSARVKNVFDRCICAMEPFIHEDAGGRFRHSYNWKMPARFVLVSTCGFPEKENFESLSRTIRAQAYNFGSSLIAELCIPGSIAFQTKPSLLDPFLNHLQKAGHELGSTGLISQETADGLNGLMLTKDEYHTQYLNYEQWCKNKIGKR
jgi:multimeric flavodoxin WrbA